MIRKVASLVKHYSNSFKKRPFSVNEVQVYRSPLHGDDVGI